MSKEARGRRKIVLCAFCRKPAPTTDEEEVNRTEKLMEADHAVACYKLGLYYTLGSMGMPQDFAKARELYLKAGELGCAEGYYNMGYSYNNGRGVVMDKKKAKHYYELAAMNGDLHARHYLGYIEAQAGNDHRAMKHFILAAKAGFKKSLDDAVRVGFMNGIVTKDEYANILRAYQQQHDEMKSDTRDKARA